MLYKDIEKIYDSILKKIDDLDISENMTLRKFFYRHVSPFAQCNFVPKNFFIYPKTTEIFRCAHLNAPLCRYY
jgi:hypothetical protein